MNRTTIRTSLFLTAMLAASATFAGTDIVKCVDQDGHVTLTDSQCGAAAEQVLVAAGSDAMPAAEETIDTPAVQAVEAVPAVRRVAVQRFVLPPAALRQSSWAAPRPASRPLARDVETLKAARVSMQVLDQASATLKHQRMAGLN
ncbi:MAG: DUF4124 domain-containing protein [Telluria sp.]